MQQVFEAATFLADAIRDRRRQRIDEKLIGVHGVATHLGNFAHLNITSIEIGVEQTQAKSGFRGLFERRRARQNQHFLRDLRRRNPHFRAGQ